MRNIRKAFGGQEVVHGVDFRLKGNEIRGLVGQNGAGKSTLMKILSGVYQPDSGEILLQGRVVHLRTPIDSRRLGIAMVYQEFSLIPQMTVGQNLFLGSELHHRFLVDDREASRVASDVFARLGVTFDSNQRVETLAVGARQLVEIAKALVLDPAVLILDEPTASLSQSEIATLFQVLDNLRKSGLGVIYISHHIDEVVRLCDWVTVLRDGSVVADLDAHSATVPDVLEHMLGNALVTQQTKGAAPPQRKEARRVILEVEHLSDSDRIRDATFCVFQGEVLGVAGLLGSGRTELLQLLFGLRRPLAGRMSLLGRAYWPSGVTAAIRAGIMLVPEDRRTMGILRQQSVRDNILLPVWNRLSRFFWIDDARGTKMAAGLAKDLTIIARDLNDPIDHLSGGNQQKALIGRALSVSPALLMLDDPTVGIDVRARYEISQHVREFAANGGAAIWVSSDMEELSQVCDRVVVLRRGVVSDSPASQSSGGLSEHILLAAIQQENGMDPTSSGASH
jgi:ribose transport system ATP-binding protein